MSNITFVSGYWAVSSKHSNDDYMDYFTTSLSLNQRYIFFCEKNQIDVIKKYRKGNKTDFIEYPFNSFYCSKYYKDHWHRPIDVPSADVGKIWNEKINLMKLAKNRDIENGQLTEFYIWIDAGLLTLRNKIWPLEELNLISIDSLPHDKLCYSKVNDYYHNFSAGLFIMHHSMIDSFHNLYYKYLQWHGIVTNDWRCGSEQFILTQMQQDKPHLFYEMSFGYGQNIFKLFELCGLFI